MSACDYVLLKGGVAVPLVVLQLLWDLEDREIRIRAKGADTLVVAPSGKLTDADRAALKRWKSHVLTLVNYDASVHQEQVC